MPVSICACLGLGLLLVAMIHTTGDGSWFWYAAALRGGQHLYGDLHLPMQPLYAIELAALRRIFGGSWLAQQMAGVCNLVLFTTSLALVARHIRWPGWQRAVVYAAAFWAVMDFISMRFDDYHVLSASCELLCADALLLTGRERELRRSAPVLVWLGLLCGTCVLNRLNDGALLTAAVMTVAFFWFGVADPAHRDAANPAHRQERDVQGTRAVFSGTPAVLSAGVILLTAACVVIGVLTAMGETLYNWFRYTVEAAAAIKGGTGGMFLYPLRLPAGTLRELFARGWRFDALTVYTLAAAAGAVWLVRQESRKQPGFDNGGKGARNRISRGWLIYVAGLLAGSIPLAKNILHGNEARVVVAFAVLGMYAAVIWMACMVWRAARGGVAGRGDPELAGMFILLLPVSQLVSISLSAERWYPNTNPPAGVCCCCPLPCRRGGRGGWCARRF